jgi:hypothetical protein
MRTLVTSTQQLLKMMALAYILIVLVFAVEVMYWMLVATATTLMQMAMFNLLTLALCKTGQFLLV